MSDYLTIEVVYAVQAKYQSIHVKVAPLSTIVEVIEASGILQRCPEIDLKKQRVGIFGQLKKLEDRVQKDCRIEIYNPLPQSAIELRLKRKKNQNPSI